MRRHYRVFFCIASVFALVGWARAQEPLTLADALKKAEASQPTVQAARASVAAAQARTRLAGTQPNPTLSLAKPYGSPATGGFGEDLILAQTIEPGKIIGPRKRAAGQQQHIAEQELGAALLDLRLSVTTAYVGCLLADGELSQARATLDAGQKFADAAQVQFTAGDAPRSNVVRSQIEVARFSQALTEATNARSNAYATLRSLLGLSEETPLVLGDTLAEKAVPIDRAALKTLALSRRPEVLAARAQVLASAAELDGAKNQRTPDLIVEGRRASVNPAQNGASSIRVGVSLPLFDNGRIRAEVLAARLSRQAQEARLKEAERVTLLEIELALSDRERAEKVVTSFEGAGRLTKSKELLQMAQIGYEKGGSGYLEVIDAQRVFASEQVEYLRALAALRVATARLERAVGGPLP